MSATECTASARRLAEPVMIQPTNFITAMPRLARKAAMIARRLPSCIDVGWHIATGADVVGGARCGPGGRCGARRAGSRRSDERARVGRPLGRCGRRRRARPAPPGQRRSSSASSSSSSTDPGRIPRTSMSGTPTRDTASHSGAKSAARGRAARSASRKRACRHTHVPSSRWTALCRMPRRSDETERVGLNWTVRSRISSKLAKLSGPLTKLVMAVAFSAVTPGVTSTSTTARTSSGCRSADGQGGQPAERHPDHAAGLGRQRSHRGGDVVRARRRGRANHAARRRSDRDRAGRSPRAAGRGPGPPCPRCGRSALRRGAAPARADATPHTSELRRRPGPTSTASRRTTGGASKGSPNSSAFSWNIESSS